MGKSAAALTAIKEGRIFSRSTSGRAAKLRLTNAGERSDMFAGGAGTVKANFRAARRQSPGDVGADPSRARHVLENLEDDAGASRSFRAMTPLISMPTSVGESRLQTALPSHKVLTRGSKEPFAP